MSEEPATTETLDDVERTEKVVDLSPHVLAVRLGHGANCSSVGSVIDTLFAGAVVTGAIFAAVCAAMASEKVTVVAPAKPADEEASEDDSPKPER
jgi:hypothetical protein